MNNINQINKYYEEEFIELEKIKKTKHKLAGSSMILVISNFFGISAFYNSILIPNNNQNQSEILLVSLANLITIIGCSIVHDKYEAKEKIKLYEILNILNSSKIKLESKLSDNFFKEKSFKVMDYMFKENLSTSTTIRDINIISSLTCAFTSIKSFAFLNDNISPISITPSIAFLIFLSLSIKKTLEIKEIREDNNELKKSLKKS